MRINETSYNLDPKICKQCDNPIAWKSRRGIFCSNSCSVSSTNKNRIVSQETKNKLSKIFKHEILLIDKKCIECNKIFEINNKKSYKTTCSKSCSQKRSKRLNPQSEETKAKISASVKQNYIDGKKIYGGRTKWLEYKDFKVQGTYELRTCFILDKMRSNNEILKWEYTNDRIPYIGLDGEKHQYLLDFKIYNNDSTFYYLEVKGFKTDLDELKWSETLKHHDLKIWYERDLIEKESIL